MQGVTVKNIALAQGFKTNMHSSKTAWTLSHTIWSAFANPTGVDNSCSIAPQGDFEMISQQN